MNQARNQVLSAIALITALALPQANAQDAAAPAAPTTDAATTTTPAPTADAAASHGASTAAPAGSTAAASGKKTWAELDTDKNGSLSKAEAAPMAALIAMFDQADSNADGALTGPEYKAYVAAAKSGKATQGAAGSNKNK